MASKRGAHVQVHHIDELTTEKSRVTSAALASDGKQRPRSRSSGASGANITLTLVLFLSLAYTVWRLQILEEKISRLGPDGIGLRDFASRYNGARVVPSLTTQTQPAGSDDHPVNSPYMAIDDDLRPGRCWPFIGRSGQLGILFPSPVKITHFTMDHISKEVALHLKNAPQRVVVWGLASTLAFDIPIDTPSILPERQRPGMHDPNLGLLYLPLLDTQYDIYSSRNIQTFAVAAGPLLDVAFEGVVVEVLSNWGWDTTCVYRVRVHGTPTQ